MAIFPVVPENRIWSLMTTVSPQSNYNPRGNSRAKRDCSSWIPLGVGFSGRCQFPASQFSRVVGTP